MSRDAGTAGEASLNGSASKEGYDSHEVIVNVDQDIVSLAIGFSIDAGGSVLKLVYRSKEDYENGKPKDAESVHGKLRLRLMQTDDVDTLVKFLQLNCDVTIGDSSAHKQGAAGEGSYIFYPTGSICQKWLPTLRNTFHFRTQVCSETDLQIKGFQGFYTKTTDSSHVYQTFPLLSCEAVEKARKYTLTLKFGMDLFGQIGEKCCSQMMNRSAKGFDIEGYKQKLMTQDASELARDMSAQDVTYPCLLIVIGSATTIYRLEEDGSSPCITFSTFAGKALLNIGKALSGAANFDELIEMAQRGKSHKVDMGAGEVKKEYEADTSADFYSDFSNDLMVYGFGKLGEEKYKGKYSNDDIAATWVRTFCTSTANTVALYALLNGATSVLFSGSTIGHPYVRECLEECFVTQSLCLPFCGGYPIKMASLPNPGFVCALGAWLNNVEMEKENGWKQSES